MNPGFRETRDEGCFTGPQSFGPRPLFENVGRHSSPTLPFAFASEVCGSDAGGFSSAGFASTRALEVGVFEFEVGVFEFDGFAVKSSWVSEGAVFDGGLALGAGFDTDAGAFDAIAFNGLVSEKGGTTLEVGVFELDGGMVFGLFFSSCRLKLAKS